MRLITAHKILIASGGAFFLFLALQRFWAFRAGGDASVLLTSIGGLAACVGLALYYRTIRGRSERGSSEREASDLERSG